MFGKGSSILLSALAVRAAVGDRPTFASTKGAVAPPVRFFAAELGSKGIRINAIAPGVIATAESALRLLPTISQWSWPRPGQHRPAPLKMMRQLIHVPRSRRWRWQPKAAPLSQEHVIIAQRPLV